MGYANGYARRLYGGSQCHVGYWKDSEPWGKFQWYQNGIIKDYKEGLWEGWGDPIHPYPIVVEEVDTFLTNDPDYEL